MTAIKVAIVTLLMLICLRYCVLAQWSSYPAPPARESDLSPQSIPPPVSAPSPLYPPPVVEIPPAPQIPPYAVPDMPSALPSYGPPTTSIPERWGQIPVVTGQVRRYILSPTGEVEGLELEDGTDVRFPPHIGDEVVRIIKPGDKVSVEGELGLFPYLGRVIKAFVIKNASTAQVVVDEPPKGPRVPPWERKMWLRPMRTVGSLERFVLNPHGDVDGLFLNNGVEVKFPPHVGREVVMLINQKEAATVEATGLGTSNAYGTVVDAGSGRLTINGILVALDNPRGRRGKRGR